MFLHPPIHTVLIMIHSIKFMVSRLHGPSMCLYDDTLQAQDGGIRPRS